MPKPNKKRKASADRAVTHDEISSYDDTSTLFKSNLFKLQQAELLREVSPFAQPPTRLEAALRALRDELTALPPSELSWERGSSPSHPHLAHLDLANESVKLAWAAPSNVNIGGSYLLRTCAAPELNVDVTIELPSSVLQGKDYLDGRYADKRLLYLTHLAHLFTARGGSSGKASKKKGPSSSAAAASSVVSTAIAPVFVCMPHMQSKRWPVLQIRVCDPTAAAAAAAGGGGGEEAAANGHSGSADTTIDGWVVRLIPCLSADAFPLVKLRTQRCNLRSLGTRPSPTYNNLLGLESTYSNTLALLHSTYSKDTRGSLREATILLKVWLRQRFANQAYSPTGFQLTLILLHLVATRKLSLQMSSYQIVRVCLNYLKTTTLYSTPIVLPHQERAGGGRSSKAAADSEEDDDDGEADAAGDDVAARKAAVAEATPLYQQYFPWVITDSYGLVNYGCGVSLGALSELSKHAATSLIALDTYTMSDSMSFAHLLTDAWPISVKYDTIISVSLPSADAILPPTATSTNLPLPTTSPDDPTDGADAIAAAAASAGGEGSASVTANVAAIEAILLLGLKERLQLCRAWRTPLTQWDPLSTASSSSSSSSSCLLIGLWLDASKSLALVDRGPSPNNPSDVTRWKNIWGDKSETRRFKDGAILHAVVWDVSNAERHTTILLAARTLLGRHVGVAPRDVRSSIGGCDEALNGPSGTGTSQTSGPLLTRAFEKLSTTIRNLKGLPLSITGVQATSSAFSDTEPFPPSPVSTGAPPPSGCKPLDFYILFESSGKWPDALDAINNLKSAFYLRLASLLEDQASIICEVEKDVIYVQVEGFTFRGIIHHEPSIPLLPTPSAKRALKWRTTDGAQHTAALSALGRTHPALGPTVRLAKRWLSCQLYSGSVSDGLIELLAAHAFASPFTRPPGSAIAGFSRFLHLLASHDFESEPLLLSFDEPITSELKEGADAAFAVTRAAAAAAGDQEEGAVSTIFVASDVESRGAACCRIGPITSPQDLSRLRLLANGALLHLDRVCQLEPAAVHSISSSSNSGGAASSGAASFTAAGAPKDAAAALAVSSDLMSKRLFAKAFDPPMQDFDVLLELNHSKLPTAHLSWSSGGGGSSAKQPKAASSYANVSHGEIARGVGDEPVASLVERLRADYGSLALFFYDQLGGRCIAVKWRPAAFLPGPLKPSSAQHRMLVGEWALPNVGDVLAGMVQASGGLVKAAKVVQSGHGLR